MLLNRTLSSMKNVVECPNAQCRNPHVMLSDDFTEGVCARCMFHFCAKCRQHFHPDTACVSGSLAELSAAEGTHLVSLPILYQIIQMNCKYRSYVNVFV